MRILYYFSETANYMEAWQRSHIFDELKRHHIFVDVFNPLEFHSIEEANDALIMRVRDGVYDLFMTCHSSEWFFPGVVEEIRRIGLKTLLICFDNMHAPFMHKKLAREFDLVWLTSKENDRMFLKWGSRRVIMLPYAANPYAFIPRWTGKSVRKVSFIGSPYGSRAGLLNTLSENKVPVELFNGGNNKAANDQSFPLARPRRTRLQNLLECASFDVGRKLIFSKIKSIFCSNGVLVSSPFLTRSNSVSIEEMLNVYSNYSLSLNSLVLRNTGVLKNPLLKLHLRTFEIPMAGGLEFSQRSEELCEYFEEDKEIVLFDGQEEMLEKARFYLKEESDECVRRMKYMARLRAEAEHTWYCRFKKIFEILEIKHERR